MNDMHSLINRASKLVSKEYWARKTHSWRPYPATDVVSCNLCGAVPATVIARRMSFGMRYSTVIRDCGLVYTSPRPSSEAFDDFYRNLYPALHGVEAEMTGEIAEPSPRGQSVADFLNQHLDFSLERGIFDIGAKNHGLLKAMAKCEFARSLQLGGVRARTQRKSHRKNGQP
jgi:hypothetical protein